MLYAVRFYDRPDRLDVRNAHLQAHIEWLDSRRDTILVPGSLRPAPGEPPVGGLWLVEAPDRQAVERVLQDDPFWIHGLRERYEIYFWSKAFPDRKVPI